ncbi:MAG: DUF3014 domain-containing protein [Cellvibrionaceae bacterium]
MANDDANSTDSKGSYLIKILLLAGAVVIAAVLLWQIAGDDTPEQPVPEPAVMDPVPPADPAPEPEPEPAEPEVAQPSAEPEPQPEPLPELAESDAVAAAAAEQLSPNTDLRDMLVADNIILKSVRALIGLTGGNVVHEYRPVDSPGGSLLVEKLDEPLDEEVGQRYRLSPRNYERYDSYVNIVTELDPRNVAAVYRRFYPLLEEAYAQHGVDAGSFKEVTLRAIDSMLAAPILEQAPILIQPKVFYEYEDPQLESLPDPQKLLLRMGPDNTRKLQARLRELRDAIEAEDLP